METTEAVSILLILSFLIFIIFYPVVPYRVLDLYLTKLLKIELLIVLIANVFIVAYALMKLHAGYSVRAKELTRK